MDAPKDLPKGFTCSSCGKEHRFSLWVYGHWNEGLSMVCDCGLRHSIRKGIATPAKKAPKDGEKQP